MVGESSRTTAEPPTLPDNHKHRTVTPFNTSQRQDIDVEHEQEKLNEAVAMMNRNLQEVNVQNMNVELVAQMFKNYQSNVLFHLEATDNLKDPI
ncbi:hypothetical protein A1O1_02892 [Capronia coronata CBS 617.96]|uniref:DASH complex subunit DAD4 n=1 Tax=Capronia coronata CBS 617.96 TaxID=1182541 RepID=W9YYY6_9EURO|nr:uncharacterized protein A1O1_02892 [Capronia coronata CBS 617.96]EXJ94496.1 hypothetical protein A1O1_02892 [Capronia coronata CBS 617.96]